MIPVGILCVSRKPREAGPQAELLLNRGADRRGKTDLFIAAALGATDKVKRLLDQDSSEIDLPEQEFNATALDAAVLCGHRGVVELLVQRGAKTENPCICLLNFWH